MFCSIQMIFLFFVLVTSEKYISILPHEKLVLNYQGDLPVSLEKQLYNRCNLTRLEHDIQSCNASYQSYPWHFCGRYVIFKVSKILNDITQQNNTLCEINSRCIPNTILEYFNCKKGDENIPIIIVIVFLCICIYLGFIIAMCAFFKVVSEKRKKRIFI